ncbi:tRNA-splicing endonuclease subunit Sen34 isoform X1 [Pteropus alecto]|uniref:tRNA-splicing endonuclease subunit Sen34 isoform X1 n=1 Tax=Pteropus alecto TaxID=9402 RepID=UPI0003F15CB8|nr:tRNA-splicing endonuclease subunit Sen34 isoform X1 [Pteropus alecto]XP_015441230.1 tRNA-splicing endonuclease subunit Sen34 isoform X1 [Pteropus alecto]
MLVVEVANGCSLVWGAEAVQALRERLGVGGRTVGSLPRGPRQNSRLGLPLLLMPEEARLLAEIGAVTLVSAPRTDSRQHSLALASFKLQQEQGFQEQSALAAEARETRRQEILEKIAEGQAAKKQKLEPDLGASESQEANAGENEASVSQASREYDEAGLLCLSSWPLLGLDPSRRGPWTGVSSPKTGPMLAVRPMSCATASIETCGSEASSSAPLASLGATSWSILVTHSVSMPTTLPSAGLLGTPSHSRIWFLLAASEPVSKRRCSCALHSLMVRWSIPPCSGPACSELQRPMGVAMSVTRAFPDGPIFTSAWEARTPSYLSLQFIFDSRFIKTASFLCPSLFQNTYWLCCFCSYLFPNVELLENEDWV